MRKEAKLRASITSITDEELREIYKKAMEE